MEFGGGGGAGLAHPGDGILCLTKLEDLCSFVLPQRVENIPEAVYAHTVL